MDNLKFHLGKVIDATNPAELAFLNQNLSEILG